MTDDTPELPAPEDLPDQGGDTPQDVEDDN